MHFFKGIPHPVSQRPSDLWRNGTFYSKPPPHASDGAARGTEYMNRKAASGCPREDRADAGGVNLTGERGSNIPGQPFFYPTRYRLSQEDSNRCP